MERIRLSCCLALGLFGAASAQQGGPSLLSDVQTTPRLGNPGAGGDGWVVAANHIWFKARHPDFGQELFVSDGTPAGTRMVADLKHVLNSGITFVAPLSDRLVFYLTHRGWGGLWTAMPSPSGQIAVENIAPMGMDDKVPHTAEGIAAGGQVFFNGIDADHGAELWVSDGTSAGTRMVADILPGGDSSRPQEFAAVGHRVVFTVNGRRELWGSDGTAAGTQRVLGAFGAQYIPGEINGRRLLFGPGLRVTDGTASGTQIIHTGVRYGFGGDHAPAVNGGVWLFAARDHSGQGVWRSDGTAAGTWQLLGAGNDTIRPIGGLGAALVFRRQQQVFATDGSADGSTLLNGPPLTRNSPGSVIGNLLVFTASDTQGDERIYATDGAGYWALTDAPTDGRTSPSPFQGRLWFTAQDGAGYEPWVTDGTTAGTRRFIDLAQWPVGATESSNPRQVERVGSGLAFLADTSGVDSLWFTDGSSSGTVPGPRLPGSEPFAGDGKRLIGRAGRLFTLTTDPANIGAEHALHVHDGIQATSLASFSTRHPEDDWRAHRDGVAVDITDGDELLISDGTQNGTGLQLITTSAGTWRAWWSRSAGSSLIVGAELRGTNDQALFRIDGRSASYITSLRRVLRPKAVANGFVLMEGIVANRPTDDLSNVEPWVTDGTPGGTRLLGDLNPGSIGTYPHPLCVVPGGLVFAGAVGDTLWFTNGTPEGTIDLTGAFGGGRFLGNYDDILYGELLGDRLVVTVTTPEAGRELKVLSPNGAYILDLLPGPASSRARLFERVGEELWFVAYSLDVGLAVYRTDGTEAGTQIVLPLHHEPTLLELRNGRVWIDLEDAQYGRELWSIDPGAVTEVVGHACGGGLRLPIVEAEDPLLGELWTIRGRDGKAGEPGFLVMATRADRPQRVADWCWTELDPSTSVLLGTIADSGRAWSWSALLPSDPALQGLSLVIESWHSDPEGPAGLASSASLLAVLGSW